MTCKIGYLVNQNTIAQSRGGHLNTSAVHMRDQRFSKHILNAISPVQEKHTLKKNFARFYPQIYP